MKRTRPAFKLWLETEEGHVFGPGVFSLLTRINETGTLKEAAQSLGMSYRYAWGLIRRAEETIGEPLISASKGGRLGGGSTEITELGRGLVEDFEKLRETLIRVSAVQDAEPVEGVILSFRVKGDEAQVTVRLDRDTLRLSVLADAVKGLTAGDAVRIGLYLA
ncbi:MAG: LysR family transcriptional regulator [Candidatus Bathyarchaeota archaeon]